MSYFQNFADLLTVYLRARHLSANAVAQRLGIHRSTVGRWLMGQSRPDPELAGRLADLLLPQGGPQRSAFLLAIIGEQSPATFDAEAITPHVLHPASLLPIHRNQLFVGRARALRAVATALRPASALVAITGMGGVGKTQLALEVAYRFGPDFPGGVFWINCQDAAQIAEQIAVCGQADHLALAPAFATLSLAEQVQLVLAAWRAPTPRLLVLDNCEDESLLYRWRPPFGGCRMLLTSRCTSFDSQLGVTVIALPPFNRRESTTLLRALLTSTSSSSPGRQMSNVQLAALAAALGDHPLALRMAGCALRDGITPDAVISASQGGDERILADLVPAAPQEIWYVFLQSYRRLAGNDVSQTLARAILACAASFAPGTAIPLALLRASAAYACAEPVCAQMFHRAIHQLTGELGLLEYDGPAHLKLHELIATFIRTVRDDPAAADAVAQALLAQIPLPNQTGLPLDPLLLRHLRYVTNERLHHHDALTAQLCFAIGENLWYSQQPVAVSYLEQAVCAATLAPGGDRLTLAMYYNCLGLARFMVDAPDLAAEDFRCALEIRMARLPVDHEDVLMSQGNLGFSAMFLGDYDQARRTLFQVFRVLRQRHGMRHPDVARLVHYFGFLALAQGRYTIAQRLLQRAFRLRRQLLAPDHPALAATMTALAEAYGRLGAVAQAECLQQQAIAIRTAVFGKQSHMVAENLRLRAYLAAAQGDYPRARDLAEQAWMLMQHALGAQHSETLLCREVAGVVAWLAGDRAGAARTLEGARAGLEARWGSGHRYTAVCYHYLGLLAWEAHDPATAHDLLVCAQAIDRSVWPRHPEAARTEQALRALAAGGSARAVPPRAPTLLPL